MSANKEVERIQRVAELAVALDEAHRELRIAHRRYLDACARRSEIAAQLVDNGASISDISRMVGVSKAAVQNWIRSGRNRKRDKDSDATAEPSMDKE